MTLAEKFKPFCDNEYADREYNAENCADLARETAIAFTEWKDGLKPNQRVSVWSKDGQFSGLFNMDTEQLFDRFLELNK